MNCSLCGAPGTCFIKTVHKDHGLVYLCEDCYRQQEGEALHPAGSSCTCHPPHN